MVIAVGGVAAVRTSQLLVVLDGRVVAGAAILAVDFGTRVERLVAVRGRPWDAG